MLKKALLILTVMIVLVACAPGAPSETAIQTAIALTTEAMPTNTVEPTEPKPTATVERVKSPTPTSTPRPTNTPEPTPTSTPRPTNTPMPRVSCADMFPEYIEELDAMAQEWDDANVVAANTARINLSEPVAQLQEIRRNTQNIEPPECGENARYELVEYMDGKIDLYLRFMAGEDISQGSDIQMSELALESYFLAYDFLFQKVFEDEGRSLEETDV